MKKQKISHLISILILTVSLISCERMGFNSKKQGIHDSLVYCEKLDYDNGKLKAFLNKDKNGNREGRFYMYYENGEIQAVTKYSNDFIVGTQNIYYPNGKLKLAVCNDYDDSPFFHITFDSTGKLDHAAGSILLNGIEIEGDNLNLKRNKSYTCCVLFAEPSIYSFTIDSAVIVTKCGRKRLPNWFLIDHYRGELIFWFVPKCVGKQVLYLYVSLRDKKGKRVYKYKQGIKLYSN